MKDKLIANAMWPEKGEHWMKAYFAKAMQMFVREVKPHFCGRYDRSKEHEPHFFTFPGLEEDRDRGVRFDGVEVERQVTLSQLDCPI